MPDLSAYIDLDINIKLRKALKNLSDFAHSDEREKRLNHLEEAIALLQDIHSELKRT